MKTFVKSAVFFAAAFRKSRCTGSTVPAGRRLCPLPSQNAEEGVAANFSRCLKGSCPRYYEKLTALLRCEDAVEE